MKQARKSHNHQEANEETFFDHVRTLRTLVFRCVGLILLASGVVHYYNQPIIEFLLKPLGENANDLQFLSPLDPLFFILKLDFTLGILMVLPIIGYLIWAFIAPATEVNRTMLPVFTIGLSTLMSIAAAVYVYLLIVPTILLYMSSISVPGTALAFTASGYFGFLLGTTAILVLIFQIPLVIIALSSLDILDPTLITQNRAYIYTGLVITTAIVTPTTDVITLGFLTVPAIIVLEAGTLIAILLRKRRIKKEAV